MATLFNPKITNPRHHLLWDRIVLIFLILGGIILFFLFDYSRIIQLGIIATFLALYLIWGIAHHIRAKTLTNNVILEYLAVVMIVVVLILSSLN